MRREKGRQRGGSEISCASRKRWAKREIGVAKGCRGKKGVARKKKVRRKSWRGGAPHTEGGVRRGEKKVPNGREMYVAPE